MRTLITWLPAVVAFFLLFFHTTHYVFLNVYLPVLLLLPQSFQAVTSGFPKLNFSETTVIPIFLFFLMREAVRWKFSLTDFFIIGFILCKFISVFINADLHNAVNRLALMLCDNLAPYVLAKGLIYTKNLNVEVAKKIIFFIFIDVLISFFEALTSINPHADFISSLFFPGNPSIPLRRFGMTRIVGPFGEALFYGIGMSLAMLLNYWMNKNQYWKANFSRLPILLFKKGTLITIVLIIGLILNLSRGPWLAVFIGYILMGIGFSRAPLRSFFFRFAFVGISLILIYFGYSYYTQISTEFINTETEANALYRFRLIDIYLDIAWEKPWFGWDVLPTKGQNISIDNQFLYLFLTNGLIALIFYVLIICWVSFRLLLRGLRTKGSNPIDSNLAITLMSILLALSISFFTVYMGEQIEVLFFLFIGWGEGMLTSKPIQQPPSLKRNAA